MSKVTLLADSGGTKTSWALVGAGEVVRVRTAGINAAVMPAKDVLVVVLDAADKLGVEPEKVEEVRFYGAGLASAEAIVLIDKVLKNVFPAAEVACGSDLLIGARAAFGSDEGVVALLGTGSNSALYNGRTIVQNVRPGGYILGDEGSGSALGKAFLADWVKGLVPAEVREKFDAEYGLTYGELVNNVYKGGNPAGYIASFAPFVLSCAGCDYVDGLVERNLRNFVERSLLQYDMKRYELAVVGSFGLACRGALERVAKEYGIVIKDFVPDPLERIISEFE